MNQEAETIIGLLQKKKFEAFYIGGKCRNELNNKIHNEKLNIKDIDIITDAKPEDITKIFPNNKIQGNFLKVVVVNFGGHEFEIATFNNEQKNKKDLINSLDIERENRDFTINAIIQDIDGEYIDYNYKYRNKKISAIQDIKDKTIRAIGNPQQKFKDDPIRILRAFRIMAELGYTIENQTLKSIEKSLNLMQDIPYEQINNEMNKLILGLYASKALTLMKEIGMFDVILFNPLENMEVSFLSGLKEIEDYSILDKLNFENENITKIEAWTVLLKPLGSEKAKDNLKKLHMLYLSDILKVQWLIDYFDLIDSEDLRNDIFKAKTGIVKVQGLMCLRDLILRLNKIRVQLNKDYKEKSKKLMDAFCSRPYFDNQLKLVDEDFIKIGNDESGAWLESAKEKLLYKLINTESFPKEEDKYMELAQEAVEEAIIEETMQMEGLI